MAQYCASKVSAPCPPGCLNLQSKIKILSLQNHTPIYTLNLETLEYSRHLAWWNRYARCRMASNLSIFENQMPNW